MKTMILLVGLVLGLSTISYAAPLWQLYGYPDPIKDSTTLAVMPLFQVYTRYHSMSIVDNYSPTGYSNTVVDTDVILDPVPTYYPPTYLRYPINMGGWFMMLWVRFDSTNFKVNNKHYAISLLSYYTTNGFNRLCVSKTGKQLIFQVDTTKVTPSLDSVFDYNTPRAYCSDTLPTLFDNQYHCVVLQCTVDGSLTGFIDGNMFGNISTAAGLTLCSPRVGTTQASIYVYERYPVITNGPQYGVYMAGILCGSRTLTSADYKTHYDTTIAHAPISQRWTATQKAEIAASSKLAVTVSPNPMTGTGIVRFGGKAGEPVVVRLLDCRGRVVRTLFDGAAEAQNTVRVDKVGLSAGVYLVSVNSGGDECNTRVMFLK